MDNDFKHKAVVFNLSDPEQKEEYEHCMKRKNFSSYIKRLIRRDIEGVANAPSRPLPVQEPQEEVEFDSSLLKNMI